MDDTVNTYPEWNEHFIYLELNGIKWIIWNVPWVSL